MRALLLAVVACGRIGFDADVLTADATDGTVASDGLPGDLVAWYRMEINDRLMDETGHAHTGACSPAAQCATVVPGHAGNGLRFDGVDDVYRIPSTPELVLASGFTVSLWFEYATTPATLACLATKGLGPADRNSWALCIAPADAAVFFADTLTQPASLGTASVLGAGSWHHYAVRWNGTTVEMIIDDIPVATMDMPIDWDDQSINVGADIESGGETQNFAGIVDDVRIYSRPLSDAELAAL